MLDEIADNGSFLEPTEAQKRRLLQMETERQQSLRDGAKRALSGSVSEARAARHQALIARFPLPWTIENLGPIDYYIVAKEGEFFDPLAERPGFRPPLDPYLLPGSADLAALASSERVRLGVETYKAINATAR